MAEPHLTDGYLPGEENAPKLKRSLKARHMNMIAIGGAIGTGLFVAGGESVSQAGPGGALLAYSHRYHGVFLDDELGGNGDLHAGFRFIRNIRRTVCG